MRTAICNGVLLTPYRAEHGGVLIEDGRILSLFPDEPPQADLVLDAGGRYISPGFIDIHTHGGGGAEYEDGTPEAYERAGKFHMRRGATTIYPTITSSEDTELFAAMDAFRTVKREMRGGPDFPGLHLEGPYFSYEERGAQDPRFLRDPSPEHYMPILERYGDVITRWSSAPELPGALELGDELRRRGILCAIGHSNATYQQVVPAFEHGYTHVTHLYSGCSLLRRINAFRYLGVVESAFLIDGMTVEIIADGCHLPGELLRLVYKFKGPDRTALVTDSMRGAGMPDGPSMLGHREHGLPVIIEEGVAKLPDRTSFAGSVATFDRLVRSMVRLAGVPLTDAVKMASRTPARIMGLADRGEIAEGLRADLILFDEAIHVSRTIVGGRSVYAENDA